MGYNPKSKKERGNSMNKSLKKAIAFFTAAVAAVTMLAVPASAKSSTPTMKQTVGNKYDVAVCGSTYVALGNTDMDDKGGSFIYVTSSGKATKIKNSVGYTRYFDYVDMSGYTHYIDVNKGSINTVQCDRLIGEKDGSRYIILNDGSKVVYKSSSMTLGNEFFSKKSGKNTVYYNYNGKKVFTDKGSKYGNIYYDIFGVLILSQSEWDGYNPTIVYKGKVVKTLKNAYFPSIYYDSKGLFVSYYDTNDNNKAITLDGKSTDIKSRSLNPTFFYIEDMDPTYYIEDMSYSNHEYGLNYDSTKHTLTLVVNGSAVKKLKNIYIASWVTARLSKNKIAVVTTNKAGTKFGVVTITLP